MLLVFASVRARVRDAMAVASQADLGIALAPLSSFTLAATFTPTLAPAQAQTIAPDGTLPTNVTQDATVNQFTVTGGSAQGSNLFHSFDTFSPAGHSVLFDLSGDSFGNQIERIFSRVTGTSASDINSSLSVLGGNAPDLFLLNPNGIIFGPNARLNLPGSFVGTTAENLQFADGLSFGTVSPLSPFPLLSISVPTGLQFGQNPGEIAVLGNGHNINRTNFFGQWRQDPAFPVQGLSVTPGNTLALLGGSVRLNGAELQPTYRLDEAGNYAVYEKDSAGDDRLDFEGNRIPIPQGEIQLDVGAVAAGTVQLSEQSEGWNFDYSNIDTYQDIAVTNRSWLNAGGLIPGRINLTGRNITLNNDSFATVANVGKTSAGPNSGIDIHAMERFLIQGIPSSLPSVVEIEASDAVRDSDPNGLLNGGSLQIFSKNLQLLDQGQIQSLTFGDGGGGGLDIDVQENLAINAETDATRPVSLNAGIFAGTYGGRGDSGDISVTTGDLLLTNGSLISSLSLGEGDGGRVDVEAEERITIQGFRAGENRNSLIGALSLQEGNSGEGVFLEAKNLDIFDGGRVSSSAFGSGETGVIVLNISDSIRVGGVDPVAGEPARIESAVIGQSLLTNGFSGNNGTFGNSGSINIQTPELELFDQGEITAINERGNQAGDIEIQTDSLKLLNEAQISAITTVNEAMVAGDGNGGNVNLTASESILLRRGSQISASSESRGTGGNITIQTPNLVALSEENSDITANAISDSGGMITIEAASVLGLSVQAQDTDQSDITASSELGLQFSGNIELNKPSANPTSGIATLPSSFANQDQVPIANACIEEGTQLVRRGRGGLPLGPNNLLHDTLFVDNDSDPINQAIALRNQGFYAKALAILSNEVEHFDLSEQEKEKADAKTADLERQATALRQLGITHKLLEQHEASQASLEQSLAIAQHLNNPEQISATLLDMGNLERAENKVTQARQHYQQALDENPGHTLKHQILANQLALEVATGNNAVAKHIAKELLDELAGDISDPLHLRTRLNVAATLLRHQKLDVIPDFLTFLYQDLEGARAANDSTAIAYALGHLGQAYEQMKQWQKAQQFSEAALQRAQSQQDIFQEYQWAWQLGRIDAARWKESGDKRFRAQSQAAYQAALQALQQLRGDLATISPALQFSFRNRVEPVYREYVKLLLASDNSQAQPSAANLSQALNTVEALRIAELDNFFQDSCLKTTPQAIQSFDSTAAVIYPIILDDRVEVIISHQGKLQHHSVAIPSEQLEQTIETFRKQLLIRSRSYHQKPGQQLYDWLIRPVLPQLESLEIETLVVVPDGALKSIPMAALFDGRQYLIEQFNVAIVPSLQLLPAKSASAIPPHALVAGISEQHRGFTSLPYVEQEIEGVQSLFPGNRLLNQSFTHEQLKRSLVETQTPIVHIATHGQFSSSADETFILAWDEQINIDQLRELLQSRDRQNLSPTELLVLSACETAVGDESAALGLAGMAVRAGARSTLASLWSVNDQSTALLMETFYQQLAQASTTKSAALRKAQLAMLDHPTYSHPYYWSAFMLMGNWQ